MATRYKDWAPTGFDTRGLGLEDRQEWLVLPVIRTRDSGPREESNFATARRILEDLPIHQRSGDGMVEVHRFGHWANGGFEIILAHPLFEEHVDGIEGALADYPILDELDFLERESDDEWEAWQSWGHRAFCKALRKAFAMSEAAYDWLVDVPSHEDTWRLYNEHSPDGPEHHSDGPAFYEGRAAESPSLTREKLAQWIRSVRQSQRKAAA
jgi:hypothetical protein